MEFFHMKKKTKVNVPNDQLRKQKYTKSTANGDRTTYAVTAEVEGTKVFKFVNEKTYNELKVPEVSA